MCMIDLMKNTRQGETGAGHASQRRSMSQHAIRFSLCNHLLLAVDQSCLLNAYPSYTMLYSVVFLYYDEIVILSVMGWRSSRYQGSRSDQRQQANCRISINFCFISHLHLVTWGNRFIFICEPKELP